MQQMICTEDLARVDEWVATDAGLQHTASMFFGFHNRTLWLSSWSDALSCPSAWGSGRRMMTTTHPCALLTARMMSTFHPRALMTAPVALASAGLGTAWIGFSCALASPFLHQLKSRCAAQQSWIAMPSKHSAQLPPG